MAWKYDDKPDYPCLSPVELKRRPHLGEVEDADAVGEQGSVARGDGLRFTFKIKRHPKDPSMDVIVEAKYLNFGCSTAHALCEAVCAMLEAEEVTPLEALKLKSEDLADFLGRPPKQKPRRNVLGGGALKKAVADWAKRRGVKL